MKKLFTLILFGLALFASQEVTAQRAMLIMDNESVEDSTIVNIGYKEGIHKWSSFYVEATFTSMAAADTTARLEIYNTINGNFTNAADLGGTSLIAATGSGGTGTIIKTVTVTNSALANLRFVCDPAAAATANAKVTVRIVPTYKSAYTPPD